MQMNEHPRGTSYGNNRVLFTISNVQCNEQFIMNEQYNKYI